MHSSRLLDLIVSRIRDQRFLFALGGIVIVASLASFHLIAAMAILASAVIIVMVDRVLEFFGPHSRGVTSQAGRLNLRVALDFEGVDEGTTIRLDRRATYTIQDPRNPGQSEVNEVLLLEAPGGMGWLCPIPSDAGPTDLVSFTLTAVDGSRWGLTLVPELLWPKARAERLS